MIATRSLEVLERCLSLQDSSDGQDSRQQRFEELIANFELSDNCSAPKMPFDQSWAFCVPTSFRAALDIKQTSRLVNGRATIVWTQGPWFSFSEGDTIYDSVMAYGPWSLANFNICLQVRKASPTIPKTQIATRSPGAVIFDVLTPDNNRSRLVVRRQKALTQDEFVRLLIEGLPREWHEFL